MKNIKNAALDFVRVVYIFWFIERDISLKTKLMAWFTAFLQFVAASITFLNDVSYSDMAFAVVFTCLGLLFLVQNTKSEVSTAQYLYYNRL